MLFYDTSGNDTVESLLGFHIYSEFKFKDHWYKICKIGSHHKLRVQMISVYDLR